jgi:molybdate transport system regulatory protein
MLEITAWAVKVKSKIWLEDDGGVILGEGRLDLLKAIDLEGSILKAAKKLNMSFRRAWSHLESSERNFGIKLLIRQRGGNNGGKSVLTPEAKTLIQKFDEFTKEVNEVTEERFQSIFGKDWKV